MSTSTVRRRVLLVSHRADLGGAPLCLWDLVETFDRDRFEVRVLLGEEGPLATRIEVAGVPVQVMDRKHARGFQQVFALRRLLGSWRPDVVHVFAAVALAKVVALAARSRGIPVLWHLHNSFDGAKFRRRLPWVRRLSTRVVCCAHSVAEPVRSAKTVVVPNGVRETSVAADEVEASVRALGLDDCPFRFGFVGAILPHKNVHLIVEALARVRGEHPEVQVLAVGGGDKPDYREFVEQRVRELDLGRHFRLHQPREDVRPYYLAADAVLLPSATECYPRVILEAAAHGVATLAAPVGDVPRMIEHGADGWLMDGGPLDVEHLVDAMLALVRAGRERALQVGEAARARIAGDHPLSAYTRDFERLWVDPLADLERVRMAEIA